MYPRPEDALPRASTVLLDYMRSALPPGDFHLTGGNTGLPASAVMSWNLDLVIAATPVMVPIFDEAVLRYARINACDVALIRHGFEPETLDPVRIDLVLNLASMPVLLPDLSFYRHASGRLHLAAAQDELFVSLGSHGLYVSSLAPWLDTSERSEGLERAAAEIVRACRRL